MIDRTQRVYFAKCIGPTGDPIGAYKIGCSYGWNFRTKQISAAMPFSLEVEATVQGGFVMETAIHLCLKEDCISGEYFHARGEVLEFVKRCATTGSPFARINDAAGTDGMPDGSLEAFMKFHEVSLHDACSVLGVSVKDYEKKVAKGSFRSRKIVAAVALAAARRGQYVNWPSDALRGLLGEQSTLIREFEREDAA